MTEEQKQLFLKLKKEKRDADLVEARKKEAEYRAKNRVQINAYSREWMRKYREAHPKPIPPNRCQRCLFFLDSSYHMQHPCPPKQMDSIYNQRKNGVWRRK